MRERIAEALNVLIGMPLWKAGRACDLHMFDFGERHIVTNRRGNKAEVGEYALHIQCAWRLCTLDRVIVASRDRYSPPEGLEDLPLDFYWDAVPQNNRFDQRIGAFFEEHASQPLIVEAVESGNAGSARLIFQHEIFLEIFPDDSLGGDHCEYWRLFDLLHKDKKPFVVTGNGIEN